MANNDYTLIGIDGGATKVSGWIINVTENNLYDLSGFNAELPYSDITGHISDFKPIDIQTQLTQRASNSLTVTEEETIQGKTYIKAAAQVVQQLYDIAGKKPVLIGIGMPGLKTKDQRGINAIANGPRMPAYCTMIEEHLNSNDVQIIAPIFKLGSDADYCGVGEFYATDGSFRGENNAYYLGGGTGAADALLLRGKLISFDQIKSWMAKTWEMKNKLNLSMERYASASGLQYIYSRYSGISPENLNKSEIYPPQIAELAKNGDQNAINTYNEVAEFLAVLIFDRIATLNCGSPEILSFINPNHPPLDKKHDYQSELFDKIIIGQRLGDLMAGKVGRTVLTDPFLQNLTKLIIETNFLPQDVKEVYLRNDEFDKEKLVFSKLRQAPALGAGIDAHLSYANKES